MSEELTFRIASPSDAQAILNIYSYYIEKTAITFEYKIPSLEDFQQRIINTLKKYPYIVALYKDKIAGYAYAGTFKGRAAYDWSVETSIYIDKDFRGLGFGKKLLLKLEEILKKQNFLNVNACIAFNEKEDQYLTHASKLFHQNMGYTQVAEFHKCAYKFKNWYNMIWMEKMLDVHSENPKEIIPFSKELL